MAGQIKLTRHLTVFLFNDLESWERACVEPILESLSQFALIETVWVTESQRRYFKNNRQGDFWIISKNWVRALDFLSAQFHKRGKLFVSVLGANQEKRNLYGLSLYSVLPKLPETATLIVYSPLDYQFHREIEKIPESQLELGYLTSPKISSEIKMDKPNRTFEVGTFCDFSLEINIGFLLSVAHYVTQQNSQIHFNIMGRGPLYGHFAKMISDLDLDRQVSIIETTSVSALGCMDLFLYLPLRNHHFIPLLLAGAYGLPVISIEVPGIESFITPEKTGVLVTSSDIRTMGQKILELERDEGKRRDLGAEFNSHLKNTASVESLNTRYQKIFFNYADRSEAELTAAA